MNKNDAIQLIKEHNEQFPISYFNARGKNDATSLYIPLPAPVDEDTQLIPALQALGAKQMMFYRDELPAHNEQPVKHGIILSSKEGGAREVAEELKKAEIPFRGSDLVPDSVVNAPNGVAAVEIAAHSPSTVNKR